MGQEKPRFVAFIPARGGSKSIPNKNIISVANRPLLYWVLDAAVDCDIITEVYVATDAENIKETVAAYGSKKVNVIGRSPATATDEASTESVLIEFSAKTDAENIVLIQATSPLLTSSHLSEAIENYIREEYDSILSVVRQKRFVWSKTDNNYAVPVNYDPVNRPRRQDFEGYFVENGAFYISKRRELLRHKCRVFGNIGLYEMPGESYFELDEMHDIPVIEHFLHRRLSKKGQKPENIRLVAMDVDGVLTDAGMYYSDTGDEMKKFNTRDGMGVHLLRERGIKTVIITSEDTRIVERRGKKLKIDYVFQGVTDKLAVIRKLCDELDIDLKDVAYIGDDINDKQLLDNIGIAACPSDAQHEIKSIEGILRMNRKGGEGAVREFAEYIIGVSRFKKPGK